MSEGYGLPMVRLHPWCLDDRTLTPVGFRYQVPASRAEDS
jgi:hypothetical protein